MSLLTAPIVKKSHILAEIYFLYLKNLKGYQYQIWISAKRS